MSQVTIYAPSLTVQVINATSAPVYPADASASFQAAVDALPAFGGKIVVAAGQYLAGGINCGTKAVEWAGEGGPGTSATLGHGATEIVVKDGTVGMTFGLPGGNIFRGPVISNLRLVAQSPAALGGILFNGISGSRLWNVTCSDFNGASAYGRKYSGGSAGSLTMYNEEHGCQANSCTIGVWGARANGMNIFGGLFDANNNHANIIIAGSTGLLWDSPGDTLTVIGGRFQSYARHIDNNCEGLFVSGTRHEAFTIGIRSTGNYCRLDPSEMSNFISGSTSGTAIAVSGTRAFVNAQAVNSVGLRVDRTGLTNSIVIDNSQTVVVP